MSDETLLTQFISGDRGALALILVRYQDRVLWYCRTRLRGPLAEDAAQETFVRLQTAATSFSGRSRFCAWLYGIARNTCRDLARQQRWLPRLRRLMDARAPDILIPLPDAPRSPDLNPDLYCERLQDQSLVRAAIERLAPELREVVLLREWDDFSYEEIASILEIPTGTVRSRLHNARSLLARDLLPILQGGAP